MEEYFNTHSSDIIYGGIVVAVVVVLYLLTTLIHKWILKNRLERFPTKDPKPINHIKRILNVLWIMLGLIALSFIFVKEEEYSTMKDHFLLVLYLGIVSIGTILAASFANSWFKRRVQKRVEDSQDPTNYKFLRYVAIIAIYFTGVLFCLLAFPSLHAVAQTALGGAGIIALVVGVSSQEALSNLVGGLFIISFKPFKVGDIIEVENTMIGRVADITLRHTVIRTFNNRMIVIPNSIINKEKLINYDLGESKCCEYIEIGISYDSDVDLAKKIMQEECQNHPLIYDNRSEIDKREGKPMIRVAVVKFDDSAVVIRVWAWALSFSESIAIKRDVFESVKKRFDAEGIEIPFPYRTIVVKNTEESNSEATFLT